NFFDFNFSKYNAIFVFFCTSGEVKKLPFGMNSQCFLRILSAKIYKRYRNIVFILTATVLLIIVVGIYTAKLRTIYLNSNREQYIYAPIYISRFNGLIEPRDIMILVVLNDSINVNEI
uniref:Uncharacterized protein n=1 Tax=Parascaris univalens TaxID=6257 RepID=A0A915CKF0_PARUN